MQRKFKSLTELEEMGYTILEEERMPVIEKHLAEQIEVYVTDDLRIESEAGIYLAEVSYREEF